jgi:ADP-heptose:LPS heptosyltransferase
MYSPKIIYFQPWGGLGDALLSTPALEAIKHLYPETLIYCQDTSPYRELLNFNPYIHRFVPSHQALLKIPGNQPASLTNKLNGEEAIFHPCYGYMRPSLMPEQLHAIDLICRMIGVVPGERRVRIHLSPGDEQQANSLIRRLGRPLVAFHAQAACSQNKEWYPERWAQVISWLKDRGYEIVQLGCRGETPIPGTVNLLGRTSIRQALALVKHARYFLGIDSVFNHAAHSFGIPGVVLFGASTPKIWGYKENINIYKGLKCQPCIDLLYDKCHVRRCMQQITVDEVIQALSLLVEQHQARAVISE